MRVFIGLPLSEEAQRGVAKIVKKLKAGRWPLRWVSEDKWHLTVAFLAKVEKMETVIKAVEAGARGLAPFTVGFKGLGAFPNLFLPKVVWMGLNGDLKSLYRLTKSIRGELEKAGVNFDQKPFLPHLTLARVKEEMRRKQRLELGKLIGKKRELAIPQQWLVDRVEIYDTIKSSYVVQGSSQLSPVSDFSNYC